MTVRTDRGNSPHKAVALVVSIDFFTFAGLSRLKSDTYFRDEGGTSFAEVTDLSLLILEEVTTWLTPSKLRAIRPSQPKILTALCR